MRAVAILSGLPLLVFIVNLSTNSPAPKRRLRAVTGSAGLRAHAAVPEPDAHAQPPPPPPSAAMEDLGARAACNGTAHVELWGALVVPGTDNEQPTAADCCRSCREYEPTLDVLGGAQCNTWVWSSSSRACWLKHQKGDELKRAAVRLERGPGDSKVAWHSGVWLVEKPCADCVAPTTYNGCIGKDRCNTSRACGSPAIDGYSPVDPKCFQNSPTATLYARLLADGTPLVGSVDLAADYDGLGVKWGIGHKKQTWKECEDACRTFRPSARGGGPFGQLACNIWTWCSRKVCFEPDAHSHSFGDCWLKFSELPESPEVNMRTPNMKPSFMRRHKTQMVDGCSWVSGVRYGHSNPRPSAVPCCLPRSPRRTHARDADRQQTRDE